VPVLTVRTLRCSAASSALSIFEARRQMKNQSGRWRAKMYPAFETLGSRWQYVYFITILVWIVGSKKVL
jgi:hypothetical protein